MKWVIRAVILTIVLGFVALAGAATLLATFDPNDYKDRIATEVKKATGRDLAFNGDIRASFFPVLGFDADGRIRGARLPAHLPPSFSADSVVGHPDLDADGCGFARRGHGSDDLRRQRGLGLSGVVVSS